MSDDNDNIFRFGTVKGGKAQTEEEEKGSIPENDYVIYDIDDQDWHAAGFLIFTPHHLAIMRDTGKGAVPVLVLPIDRVTAAEIIEPEDYNTELPL